MIKDNSAYLIKEIKKATDEKIASLKQKYKHDLVQLKKELKHKHKEELDKLDASLSKQRKDFVKQQENMILLQKDHQRLAAEAEVVAEVQELVAKEMKKSPMITAILKSLEAKKDIGVPKGAKKQGATVRKDNKVTAVQASGTPVEFDIDEFLEEQKGIIYEQVRQQL